MTTIAGTWDISIKTPVGTLQVEYLFTEDSSGTATMRGETTPLQDVVVDGAHVTWRQSVTKPMRLNLEFDVSVDGDLLTGQSRAGRLPRSQVIGQRRA
ncbi:hypothetical protein [Mycolicibacterium mengxianglii]|uniref:hypothetical protein n=1 Tax=Mycolicibacterium mengxianglii TaxID=2736649 RepID=UPI0018D13737|nr:hypothetical protein [Mycolicibacterium mengxianglii]